MNIIILEGGDGSGKTTLAKQLVDAGAEYVKFDRNIDNMYREYSNLLLKSLHDYVVLDRSFITDIVYRLHDDKKPDNMNLQQMLYIIQSKSVVIIHCETDTSYEDSMRRGEDNITDKQDADAIKILYNVIIKMFEKYTKVPVFKYNWQKQKPIEVIKFINNEFGYMKKLKEEL